MQKYDSDLIQLSKERVNEFANQYHLIAGDFYIKTDTDKDEFIKRYIPDINNLYEQLIYQILGKYDELTNYISNDMQYDEQFANMFMPQEFLLQPFVFGKLYSSRNKFVVVSSEMRQYVHKLKAMIVTQAESLNNLKEQLRNVLQETLQDSILEAVTLDNKNAIQGNSRLRKVIDHVGEFGATISDELIKGVTDIILNNNASMKEYLNIIETTVTNSKLREHLLQSSDTDIVEKMIKPILSKTNFVLNPEQISPDARTEIQYALRTFASGVAGRKPEKNLIFTIYLNKHEKEIYPAYDPRQLYGYNFASYLKYYSLYLQDENELPT